MAWAKLNFVKAALLVALIENVRQAEGDWESDLQTAYASIPDVVSGITTNNELLELSISEVVNLLCTKQVSAAEYTATLLTRIGAYACINAFASFDPAKVMSEAKAIDARAEAGENVGPLCGLGIVVKDNIDVLGYPTVAGTPALEGMRPTNSSPVVTKILNANGIVLGKTRMHELAAGVSSINPYYGPVLNPYDNTAHVGGSSGGTAAIVAARGAPAGFCTDTGGSCRIPGAMNGIVGYRPTTGCYNGADGVVPMTTTRDTVGFDAKTVADVIIMNAIVTDCPSPIQEVTLNGTRVGKPRNYFKSWEDIDRGSQAAFDAALAKLTAAGVVLVDMDMEPLTDFTNKNLSTIFFQYEMPRELSRYLYTHEYDISTVELLKSIATPGVQDFVGSMRFQKLDAFPTPVDYAEALGTGVPYLMSLWESYFNDNNVDIIMVPTSPIPASQIPSTDPYVQINGVWDLTYNVIGRTSHADPQALIPGISVPIGLADNNMPLGLQFHARSGDDGTLLSYAAAFESLFTKVLPPPAVPSCQGCTPRVEVINATYPKVLSANGSLTTIPDVKTFMLDFDGQCALKTQLQGPVMPLVPLQAA